MKRMIQTLTATMTAAVAFLTITQGAQASNADEYRDVYKRQAVDSGCAAGPSRPRAPPAAGPAVTHRHAGR